LARISLHIPEKLLQELDDKVVNSRYKNRSELIRDLVRRYVDGTLYPISVTERRKA